MTKIRQSNKTFFTDSFTHKSLFPLQLLNPRKEGRGSVSKTIVIITDGDIPDFSEVNSIAETLRNRGIRIIALSNGVNSKYKTYVSSLRLIASGPKEYYRVENAQFNEILAELQKTVCISKPQSK